MNHPIYLFIIALCLIVRKVSIFNLKKIAIKIYILLKVVKISKELELNSRLINQVESPCKKRQKNISASFI